MPTFQIEHARTFWTAPDLRTIPKGSQASSQVGHDFAVHPQARRRRSLLVTTSSNVYIELDGASYDATSAIKEDLANVITAGTLAVRYQCS